MSESNETFIYSSKKSGKHEVYSNLSEIAKSQINSYKQALVVNGIEQLSDDKVIKGAVHIINKVLQFTPFSVIADGEFTMFLKEKLKNNGFNFIEDSLLTVICNGYVNFVVNGILTEIGFECLTQSVYEAITERCETQKEAELMTENQLYKMGLWT